MMATDRDIMLSSEDAKKVLDPMRRALAHTDVLPAIEAWQRAGIRMAALTNSACEGVCTQLESAGTAGFFE